MNQQQMVQWRGEMIQVAPGKWINPRYMVAAVLYGDDERKLTLTLDASTGVVAERYLDITGLWVGHVMSALGLREEAK
jgi:hypothetical protein